MTVEMNTTPSGSDQPDSSELLSGYENPDHTYNPASFLIQAAAAQHHLEDFQRKLKLDEAGYPLKTKDIQTALDVD